MKQIIDELLQGYALEKGSGLSLAEIEGLKEEVNFYIPDFFSCYLHTFGFTENLFTGVFNDQADFLEQNEFIQELGYTDFIAIGDAYNENLILSKIENQKLFLLEDDLLMDLNITFPEMLIQAVAALDGKKFEQAQQVDSVYESLQKHKMTLRSAFIASFSALQTRVTNRLDTLYGLVIAKNKDLNKYNLCAGSFNTFCAEINKETVDYEKLWNPEKMDYHQTIAIDDLLLSVNTEVEYKALDLLFLDVLRDLTEEEFFKDHISGFSISILSENISLFPEDSYDESLMKDNNLETKIRRFWESAYERTRVISESL